MGLDNLLMIEHSELDKGQEAPGLSCGLRSGGRR
jgi:hypothetical protein